MPDLLLRINKGDVEPWEVDCDFTTGYRHAPDDYEPDALWCDHGNLRMKSSNKYIEGCPTCNGSGKRKVTLVGDADINHEFFMSNSRRLVMKGRYKDAVEAIAQAHRAGTLPPELYGDGGLQEVDCERH